MKKKRKIKVTGRKEGICRFCGRYGMLDPHHVFNGTSGKIFSEKYNAIEWPCRCCHEWDNDSIHRNSDRRRKLKQKHQKRIMKENNWTIEDFRREHGENYL